MISKIKDTSAQVIQQYQKSDLTNKTETDKPSGAASPMLTEKVDLSAKAKNIQQIKKIVDEVPDVREDKVKELKRQIENGKYVVDTDQLAEKMTGESLIDILA
jgi:negative regulator of flagellin synthesis FlgM